MRILIIPLAALAPTRGSQKRVELLIEGFKEAGFEVATCAARDLNYREKDNISNYFLETPIPMGLPSWIGRYFFQFATVTGLSRRKTVHSFDEVLFLTGTLDKTYFKKSIASIRQAIKDYKPDLVYSEFNLSAIVAAGLEDVKVFTDYSFPVQAQYACRPKLAKGVNKVLQELGLQEVQAAQMLFERADYKIIPSCYELEPIEGEDVLFTGPFSGKAKNRTEHLEDKPNKIIAYMGTGTISNKQLIRELERAFLGTEYEVYIGVGGMKKHTVSNIHIAPFIDFEKLLPTTVAMIHHGGQNSMMDALRFGVPQLICPGKVFERKYNARTMVDRGAGLMIAEQDFCSDKIKAALAELIREEGYRRNSEKLWQTLEGLGSVGSIVELIKNLE